MTRRHSGQNQFKQAIQIAQANNMFVATKDGPNGVRYSVFRKMPDRNVCLGNYSSPEVLFRKVELFARTK